MQWESGKRDHPLLIQKSGGPGLQAQTDQSSRAGGYLPSHPGTLGDIQGTHVGCRGCMPCVRPGDPFSTPCSE